MADVDLLAPRAPYWGQSGSRCFRPTSQITGVNWARTQDVVPAKNGGFPRVGWARWWIQGQDEKVPVGDAMLLVRMEYPTGVFTYATENINAGAPGSPAAVLQAANTTLFLNFNKFVPAGAFPRFRVIQIASNIVYRQGPGAAQAYPNCYLQQGTGTPPAMDDAFPGTPAEYSYPPVAYLTQTRRPSVLLIGDSREEGPYSEDGRPPFYENGLVGPAIGTQMGYMNLSESGTGTNTFMAAPNKARRLELAQYVSHVGNLLGYNDMNAFSQTEAQTVAAHTAFAALFPDNIVFGCTVMNGANSSDGYTTKANQTQGATSLTTRRYNNLVRKGIPGEAFYLDVDDAVNPERNGKFPVGPNPFDAARTGGCTFTGRIDNGTAGQTGDVLTVTAITTGSLNYGDPLTDSLTGSPGGTVLMSGCQVLDQLSGTTGGVGTYRVSRASSTASRTMYVGGWATVEAIHQTKMLAEQVMQKLIPAVASLIR